MILLAVVAAMQFVGEVSPFYHNARERWSCSIQSFTDKDRVTEKYGVRHSHGVSRSFNELMIALL